jgi:hypothetical protein
MSYLKIEFIEWLVEQGDWVFYKNERSWKRDGYVDRSTEELYGWYSKNVKRVNHEIIL